MRRTKQITIGGETVTLYPISVLAVSIGRKSETVRKWEIAGIIPPTPFRDSRRNRYYTQDMVNIIVECAEKYRIGQGRSLVESGFTKAVEEAFVLYYESIGISVEWVDDE